MSTRVRTIIVTLIAACSFASATIAPVAAQANTTQKELKEKSYTCEHTATNMTVCTDKQGHEWYCEESTDECAQIKFEVGKTTKLHIPSLTLNALPVATTPPVVTPPVVTSPVRIARLAA